MFCHKCGTQLLDESEFCHHCGTRAVAEPRLSREESAVSDNPDRLASATPPQAQNVGSLPRPEEQSLPQAHDQIDDYVLIVEPCSVLNRLGGEVVANLEAGASLRLLSKTTERFDNTDYFKVAYDGRPAYVKKGGPDITTVVVAKECYALSDARPDAARPWSVVAGTELQVLRFDGNFVNVTHFGRSVFIERNYLHDQASEPTQQSQALRETPVYGQRSAAALSSVTGAGINGILPWVSFLTALAVAGSALMPWAKAEFIVTATMAGTHLEQGKAVLVLGLIAAGVALLRAVGLRSFFTSGLQFGLASGALGCAVYVLHQAKSCGDLQILCDNLIGEGLYFSVLAGGALVGLSAVEVILDVVTATGLSKQT